MNPLAILAWLKTPLARYVGGAVVLAILAFLMVHQWHIIEDKLREEGRVEERAKVAAIIAKNDANNRALEQSVQSALNAYGARLDERLKNADAVSRSHANVVSRIIEKQPQVFNNPACATPESVIVERNKIREQGPR